MFVGQDIRGKSHLIASSALQVNLGHRKDSTIIIQFYTFNKRKTICVKLDPIAADTPLQFSISMQ